MRKCLKSVGVGFIAFLLTVMSCVTVFGAGNHFYIPEIKMNIQLPEEMIAITRESPETDKYFSVFGLDYQATMAQFESANIYLQGMYSDSSRVITVTSASDNDSKSIDNYNKLSDEQLVDVQKSFLAQPEYTSCNIQRYNDYVYMDLQVKTQSGDTTVYAAQCNTVVNGNNITITLQPSQGSELTNADYNIFGQVISSVDFSGRDSGGLMGLVEEPLFWIAVICGAIVIGTILAVVISLRRKKRRIRAKTMEKRAKNDEVLKQLAMEYSSSSASQSGRAENNAQTEESFDDNQYSDIADNGYDVSDGDESAEDIIREFRRNQNQVQKETPKKDYSNVTAEEIYKRKDDTPLQKENTPLKEENTTEDYSALKTDRSEVLKIVTPGDNYDIGEADEDENPQDAYENKQPKGKSESENYSDKASGEAIDDYAEDYAEEAYDEDEYDEGRDFDGEEDGNEVVGSEESFSQSEDYFDEAPEYEDCVDSPEKRKIPKKNNEKANSAGNKAKTAGAVALNGILIFLNGIKSFFIHLGYFITNVTRLIKRKNKARKRKKAELERRRRQEDAQRRRRENMQRKQQKNRELEENGLMKVHSRTAPNQRKTTGASRRPSKR